MVYTTWYIPIASWYIPSKSGIYHEATFQMVTYRSAAARRRPLWVREESESSAGGLPNPAGNRRPSCISCPGRLRVFRCHDFNLNFSQLRNQLLNQLQVAKLERADSESGLKHAAPRHPGPADHRSGASLCVLSSSGHSACPAGRDSAREPPRWLRLHPESTVTAC
jgi:hypothetical protein